MAAPLFETTVKFGRSMMKLVYRSAPHLIGVGGNLTEVDRCIGTAATPPRLAGTVRNSAWFMRPGSGLKLSVAGRRPKTAVGRPPA